MKKIFFTIGLIMFSLAIFGQQWNGNSNTDDIIWRNGKIGIGTDMPTQKLEVLGNIKSSSSIFSSAYYLNGLEVLNTNSGFLYLGLGNFASGIYTNKKIRTTSSIEPYTNFSSNLGQSSARWGVIYGRDLDIKGELINIVPSTNTSGIYAASILNNSSENASQHGLYLQVETGGGYLIKSSINGGLTKDAFVINNQGKVGIGTTTTGTHKLAVEGTIGAREIVVETGEWSDFVFAEDYELRKLEEVESFIEENNHLPDIPSEKVVLESGVALGEMDAKLLQKIEELTLYLIEQNKEIQELKEEIKNLKETSR
ncbi:hypothetical protein EYV94_28105 [Puteibacter caeruleilacunae]|nr:hypothetical protein EYV94_28105 [Puteibacter caeruleilacunae]